MNSHASEIDSQLSQLASSTNSSIDDVWLVYAASGCNILETEKWFKSGGDRYDPKTVIASGKIDASKITLQTLDSSKVSIGTICPESSRKLVRSLSRVLSHEVGEVDRLRKMNKKMKYALFLSSSAILGLILGMCR